MHRKVYFFIVIMYSLLQTSGLSYALNSTTAGNSYTSIASPTVALIPFFVDAGDSATSYQQREFIASVRDSIVKSIREFTDISIQFQPLTSGLETGEQLHDIPDSAKILYAVYITAKANESSVINIRQPHVESSFENSDELFDIALESPDNIVFPLVAISTPENAGKIFTAITLLRLNLYGPAAVMFHSIIDQSVTDLAFLECLVAESHLRLALHSDLSGQLESTHLDSAKSHYSIFLADTLHQQTPDFLRAVHNNYAVALHLTGQRKRAIEQLNMAMEAFPNDLINSNQTRIYHNLAAVYLAEANWKSALDVYQRYVERAEANTDQRNLALIYDNMGSVYQILLQRLNAIQCFNKSLAIRKESGDSLGIANSYHFLGDVSDEKKDYASALQYYKLERLYSQLVKNLAKEARACQNMGRIFMKTAKIDSAFLFTKKSMHLMSQIKDTTGLIVSSNQLAELFLTQNQSDSAITHYNISLKLAAKDIPEQARTYDALARMHNQRNQPESALQYYESAAHLYEQTSSFENLSITYFNMGLLYLKLYNYPAGYEKIKLAMELDEQYGFANLKNEKDFLYDIERLLQKSND
ncbi:tetratricopeptide repeat protein [candidate division KSB1 bacterium]|nr:tetratricopeptide repeat protein [candidate division KSB1 bacterium]